MCCKSSKSIFHALFCWSGFKLVTTVGLNSSRVLVPNADLLKKVKSVLGHLFYHTELSCKTYPKTFPSARATITTHRFIKVINFLDTLCNPCNRGETTKRLCGQAFLCFACLCSNQARFVGCSSCTWPWWLWQGWL